MKQVCKKCKKETDKIKRIMFIGNEKLLNPGTRPYPPKCPSCGRSLSYNDKIILLEDSERK